MGAVDKAHDRGRHSGIILMENAAQRVVEYMARTILACWRSSASWWSAARAIMAAMGLRWRASCMSASSPGSCGSCLIGDPDELRGDAAQNLAMLRACGLQEYRDFGPEMRTATLVIDAVLGTGLERAGQRARARCDSRNQLARFRLRKSSRWIFHRGFRAKAARRPGEYVRADATVTFTAPKVCHAMPPGLRSDGRTRNRADRFAAVAV